MLKGPVARGDRCVLEFGNIFFEVDPKVGGRVTSARVAGLEVLTTASVNAVNYGSTFWTAPQADWQWPPVAEIDSDPYAVEQGEASFTLVSPPVESSTDAVAGLQVKKRFSADLVRQAILVEYTLVNTSRDPKRAAPWEITRVERGGLTFYASDSAPMRAGDRPLLATSRGAGAYWFQHDERTPVHGKLNADGKGWVAHVTPQRALLIKSFEDIQQSQAAVGEGEVEIYANLDATSPEAYVEVENQGAYGEIAAGAALTWAVRWYLKALPPQLVVAPGSADLIALVAEAIQ
ncbi:MAG TPA: hypothetical protein VFQ35_25985 [Polyangiaceae bacterium]|nr:hypothetical protein [Polyangiaceae bacterium]